MERKAGSATTVTDSPYASRSPIAHTDVCDTPSGVNITTPVLGPVAQRAAGGGRTGDVAGAASPANRSRTVWFPVLLGRGLL
jgi:hypothetical protein